MAKYPCGTCGINVRSSAILCTGFCKKWFHFKCVNLSLSDIKDMESENSLQNWKFLNCRANRDKCDIIELCEDDSDQLKCLSLADEINKSIISQNEELREELFNSKNNKSLYVLELEDRVKEVEDSLELQKKTFSKIEEDLKKQIKSLERKLKSEEEVRVNLLAQIDEEINVKINRNNRQDKPCSKCTIYKKETENMLDSIRTLETIIKALEKDGKHNQDDLNKTLLKESSCLHCFPPLKHIATTSALQATTLQNEPWKMVSNNSRKAIIPQNINISCENSFEILSTDILECDKLVEDTRQTSAHKKNLCLPKNINISKDNRPKTFNSFVSSKMNQSKLTIMADSHGKNLSDLIH
ncbi:hypothetical protein J6590_046428 [Homalodisca vitripennis]|nr:hypothetical protein J6590_046428 [Homalodisca vitripennis]